MNILMRWLMPEFFQMNVAAAVVGAAVVGSVIASDASSSAADTQAGAARDASATQLQAQREAIAFQQQQVSPYTDAGKTALAQYQNQLNGGAANFDVSKIPGYQFQKDQALGATQNSSAATTGALSGNAQIALQDRAQGVASTQYNSYLDRLAGLVSLGGNAAVGAGNTGAGIIQGTGNSIASNTIGSGNVQAAGQIAQGNAFGSAVNSNAVQQSLGSLFGGSNNTFGSGGASGTAGGAAYDPYAASQSGGFIPQGL